MNKDEAIFFHWATEFCPSRIYRTSLLCFACQLGVLPVSSVLLPIGLFLLVQEDRRPNAQAGSDGAENGEKNG